MPRKSSWRSRVRWLLFTVGVALLVAGLMLVPTLWDFIPRPTRRLLIERFLIVSLVGYGVVVSLSLAGLVVLAISLVRLHRRGGNWRPWARAWLLSASMLIALVMAEAGALALLSLRIPSEPRLPESLPLARERAAFGRHRRVECTRLSIQPQTLYRPDRRLEASRRRRPETSGARDPRRRRRESRRAIPQARADQV